MKDKGFLKLVMKVLHSSKTWKCFVFIINFIKHLLEPT